jgi:hypothetical protein
MSEIYRHPSVVDVTLTIDQDGETFGCFVRYRIVPPMYIQGHGGTPEEAVINARDQLIAMSDKDLTWYVRPGG